MTIDEAIEHERELAKVYRCVYECECDFYGAKFVYDNGDRFDCVKDMREHEQLAEWLEELKAYREIGTVEGYKNAIECYTEEYTNRKSGKQYNKAIDDFMDKLCNHCMKQTNECYKLECPFCTDGCDIVNIAEQLKGVR